MSLTSTELNYLVWRYLLESGFELAAYALEKHSLCLSHEDNNNSSIISKVKPGCLVNLVQKGILFGLSEEDISDGQSKEKLSLFGALLEDELDNERSSGIHLDSQTLRNKNDYVDSYSKDESSRNNYRDIEMEEEKESEKSFVTEGNFGSHLENNFESKTLSPALKFPESLTCEWNPTVDVFAFGKMDSTAIINAIKDDCVLESVTLMHPNILGTEDEINLVSWSPKGNAIVTVSINGELRAWSPDGKLKNVANPSIGNEIISKMPNDNLEVNTSNTLVTDLRWNEDGQYFLSVNANGQVNLWDGITMNLITKMKSSPTVVEQSILTSPPIACWLTDDKFALTSPTNTINIYSVLKGFVVQPEILQVGQLSGHNNYISFLAFDHGSKFLASCSDFNYLIKVWMNSSTKECVELNVGSDNNTFKRHLSPIIGLEWLDHGNLVSVSMEGVVNIWDASNGNCIYSTNILTLLENFRSEEYAKLKSLQEPLLFNVSLSPNKEWLVVGDDYGRVSVWGISIGSTGNSSTVTFLGIYNLDISDKFSNEKGLQVGICDISWNSSSLKFCVSYKGTDSAVFNWP
ncbi:uncharacterized protein PRCAT00001890001 [Priceomyces carsonii]|uniref:uncharacterized protein n=1 Tax=Priceomyces carsonii TaxID=28549 RepID=UPI002EDA31EA|nr:unnamed protein product [Priceomyces carsonii]